VSDNQIEQSNTDNSSVTAPEASNEPKKAYSLLQITGIILLVVILLSAAGGYYLWEFVTLSKDTIEQKITTTKINVSSLSNSLTQSESKLNQQINSLNTLQNELSTSVEALLARSTHMRKDWLISEAEYLVKLAVNRLALEDDIKTAIIALSNADIRLREAGDPGLLLLRQEISNNIIKLKAIPAIDISGMSLKITSIIQQVNSLPLMTPDPESIKQIQQDTIEKNKSNTPSNWKEVTSKVVTDLTSLIRIRKHDQIVQPLLSPEQRFYLNQNIKLQLEQARTALLHQQQNIFQERITGSISWIKEYFDQSKTATRSAIALLSDLMKVQLTHETPDLSYSLKLFTDFQAGIRLKKKSTSVKHKKTAVTNSSKQKRVKNKKLEKKSLPKKSVVKKIPAVNTVTTDKKSDDQKSIKNKSEQPIPLTPAIPGVSL
jgi:uroporphyrin-3 C-methyltransferase